jgi:hypothetical protein
MESEEDVFKLLKDFLLLSHWWKTPRAHLKNQNETAFFFQV